MSAESTDHEPRCGLGKMTNNEVNQEKRMRVNDILTYPPAFHTVNYRYSGTEYHCCPDSKIDETKYGTHIPQVLTTFLPNELPFKEPSIDREETHGKHGRYSDGGSITKKEMACLQCHSCRNTLVNISDGLSEVGSSNSEVTSSIGNESNGDAFEQLTNAEDFPDTLERTRSECDSFEEESVYIFNPISYISENFASDEEKQ